jgi:hypothetical protein
VLLVFRVRLCPFLVVVGGRHLWVVGVGNPCRWWAIKGYCYSSEHGWKGEPGGIKMQTHSAT